MRRALWLLLSMPVLMITGCGVRAPSLMPERSPIDYVATLMLPDPLVEGSPWSANHLGAITLGMDGSSPTTLLLMPDGDSVGPARIARVEFWPGSVPYVFRYGEWIELRDEHGRRFAESTLDPESVRLESIVFPGKKPRIIWTSEGIAARGIQPAIYRWTIGRGSVEKIELPDAFLWDDPESPTRGVQEDSGFEALAKDPWINEKSTLLATVERPLIQDAGTGICRVFVLERDAEAVQYGYPLGPPPSGTDPRTLAIAEMYCVGPGRYLTLENAERPDGETVATIWACTTRDAEDLSTRESLRVAPGRPLGLISKHLLLDLGDLPRDAGLGDFEGMLALSEKLFLVESSESAAARVLLLKYPRRLRRDEFWRQTFPE